MPSNRTITVCGFLFVASALISLSLRTSQYRNSWPSLFHTATPAPAVPKAFTNVAFATFLSGDPKSHDNASISTNVTTEVTVADESKDGYYLGARVLAYNLLHNPSTRTNNSIPFIVLVTTDVSPAKRARLAADGATVILTKKLNAGWVHPGAPRWRDVLAKLRLFQLTQYRKICFIDADMLVTAPLDGVFDDVATDLVRTKTDPDAVKADEAALPLTYMFAGKAEAFGYDHAIPPAASDYLNSGFFVFRPSEELFRYYVSLLAVPNRFDPAFPEQNLLNYAHRRGGNMPWQTLEWRWNMNWPTMRDFELGARSFHAKYWDGDPTHDPTLRRKWEAQRDEMRGYYRGLDDALGGRKHA